jgi:RNA polymerase sigma-70 factor (ECF subfamily)
VSPDPATDREDLLGMQRGEEEALNRLIARWQRPLISFAYRYVQNSADAQDLVAEAFVRLYQRRGRLRPDTNLPAWLFTTLSNLCHNHYRWRRRHPTVAFGSAGAESSAYGWETAADPATAESSPDEALARDESLAALKAAIDSLAHDLKVSVLLHHYQGLSYRDIAAITRCTERGVETRLYRARLQLRQVLTRFLRETTQC